MLRDHAFDLATFAACRGAKLEFAGGHAVRHLDESLEVRAAWGDKERELSL